MKIGLWLALLLPTCLIGQFKFSIATQDLVVKDHFSGSVVGIADMNADGLDDIIRLQNSRILSIAYQTAPGQAYIVRTFGSIASYEFWNVTVGDVNQDGLNDMVFGANENFGYIYYSVILGDSIAYQKQALPGSDKAYAQAGNLVDINNDGWLDYFLCNDIGENKIWANSGGRLNNNPVPWIDFTTVPASDMSGNYSSVWSDLDGDRDLDLYIAKCKGAAREPTDPRRINVFYRNDVGGVFKEVGKEAGLAIADQSWSVIAGDSDNDGDQDLFIINHFAPCRLMINDGKGKFTEATSSGIDYNAVGVQVAWVDLDNDGWLDLIITGSQHHIYRNKGQNKYELTAAKQLGIYPIESMAIGDLNLDGRLDIYASYSLVFNESSHRPDAIWLNQSNTTNHYLRVRLTGVGSNRSAIGAKIIVSTPGLKQTREIFAGMSYGINNSLTQHFGLGTATKVDSVTVLWPDGFRETILSPFIDRTLVITENLCFGFDPVLTPVPNKTVLCALSDSVTLSAPVTGAYLWNNGSTNRSIVVKTSGSYQVKIKTSGGCDLYSNFLAVDYRPNNKFKVQIEDSIFCQGAQTMLTISTNRPLKWNTGDSASSIIIKASGKYFATVQDICVSTSSDTASIRFIALPPLIIKNDTVPLTGKASLGAQGPSVFWFAEKSGGSSLAAGNMYNTPPLNRTTSYYAQSVITNIGKKLNLGIKDFSGITKFHNLNFSGRLFFDANAECILKSVKVYADTAGLREVDLVDANGNILASKLIRIEKGESRVALNFKIPAGFGYSLANNEDASIKVFGSKSPRLYRTEGVIPYPLISGPITLYGTNAGPSNYYYYYDWEVSYPDLVCEGERVPVLGVVKTVGVKDGLNNMVTIYPNPTEGIINIEWKDHFQVKNVELELVDQLGRLVLKPATTGSNKMIINNLGLEPGLYYLKVKLNDKLGIFKIHYIDKK